MARKTTKDRNEELKKEGKRLHFFGLKLRMYPLHSQETYFNRTIGSARFTYNFYLNEKMEVYKETGQSLSYSVFKKAFNQLKDHPYYNFLKEPDKFALESAMENVDDAFERFFKGQNRYPRRKKKHAAKQSYTTKSTNNNIKLDIEKQKIQLPKAGWVPVRLSAKHRKMFAEDGFPGKIQTATITRHSSGQWFVSLKIEQVLPIQPKIEISNFEEAATGCDLGITHFLITSDGEKIENPRYLNRSLKHLASLQKQLSKKKKGSKNFAKAKRKVAKLHLKITNQRKDFLHKISRQLVNENQVIVLEDLNVKGMVKNKKLARHISDVSWSTFKTLLSYKCGWEGKYLILVDRFFPSSKQCGGCGEKNVMLTLSERIWACSSCGQEHDRDINAAKNIKKEGLRLLQEELATA